MQIRGNEAGKFDQDCSLLPLKIMMGSGTARRIPSAGFAVPYIIAEHNRSVAIGFSSGKLQPGFRS